MPNFTWEFDAPSGTYKSHEVSSQILDAAMADSVFVEHIDMTPGFGTRRGESLTIPRISNLAEPTSVYLSETQDIPEDAFSMSTIALTLREIGRQVPFTGFSRDMSMIGLEQGIRRKLRQQMTLAIDTIAAAAAKLGKLKYAITGAATSNFTTNGTFGAASTANMNVYHASALVDLMYDTYHMEEVDGGGYLGIFRQLALRGIMNDPDWEIWHQYTDPQAKYQGEVGKIDNLRFVRTNHAAALGKVGTGSVLGEGVCFGANALAMIEGRTPELYASPPRGAAGRFNSVAWYGQIAVRMPWEDSANAGEANLIHVGSL
jgi:N4-gp56 family major capsid protein